MWIYYNPQFYILVNFVFHIWDIFADKPKQKCFKFVPQLLKDKVLDNSTVFVNQATS